MTTDTPTPDEVELPRKGPFTSIEDMVDALSDDKEFAAEFRRKVNTTDHKLHNEAHVLMAKYVGSKGYETRLAIINETFARVRHLIERDVIERCAKVAETTPDCDGQTMGTSCQVPARIADHIRKLSPDATP